METEQTDLAGFRLHRFEVLNWGTFDRKVWKIEPLGHNSFLTGDIGSGKSSLVDALTTLLVPAHRIVYNRAAGAERSERDLLSYVRGDFKEDRTRSASKVVSLRPGASYSVILGYFHNDGFAQGITLAQVFWTKGDNAQPEKLYLLADRPLTITDHFSNFGQEIAGLKKRLRKESDLHLFDSYTQYAREFRRRMDIRTEQALDLFYQTVALKTVDNLTAFVREHMLEKAQIEERLVEIRQNFDNLNRAHAAVKKAKDQIQRLDPLVADCDRWREISKGRDGLVQCRGALHAFFAAKKLELLEERLQRLEAEKAKLADRLAQQREELEGLARTIEELRESIRAQGGGRLETIARDIERGELERSARDLRAQAYSGHCKKVGLRSGDTIESFHENRAKAQAICSEAEAEKKRTEEQRVDLEVDRRKRWERAQDIRHELDSLRGRASNIPSDRLRLRLLICNALSIPEESLPFAGELLQIRQEHGAWEGALERVLRNFGRSLLVPEESYAVVSRFVDKTDLRDRLVYIRVRAEAGVTGRPSDRRHLAHKLQVKPGSAFQRWLEQELIKHFDFLCCESLEEFQRETKALTRQGQVKTPGGRHEKDDRFRIEDRSHYVLGWSNLDKVQALERQLNILIEDEKKSLTAIKMALVRIAELEARRDAARDLLGVTEYQDIDWKSSARRIADLEDERKRITAESNVLRTLQASLKESEQKFKLAESAKAVLLQEQGVVDGKLTMATELKNDALGDLAKVAEVDRNRLFPKLEDLRKEAPSDRKFTIESCDNCQTQMREWLQAQIDDEEKKLGRLREKILHQMHEYKTEYSVETRDVDASLESADEFRSILARLRNEDLPRHEAQFKRLLDEGTINDIALFQNQLDKEGSEIGEKIARINQSLHDIDYNAGTFIELVAEQTHDAEIRDFQRQLRECLGGTLSGQDSEYYSEHKFLQVKAIIDRFRGREGTTEIDQKWTRKVTDVRNWYEFLVYERWRESNEIKETYSDSAGKSGGQKEKLAYTILASAIAYQFGLGWAETRSKAFRFVMIDEAFGRGSDESARYALTLFSQLNIQLLVVTPLQKIHVIEDFVRSVHFVHNPKQSCSMLKNLTIEQFRADRARHKQQALSS